jgi:hypothetical protein
VANPARSSFPLIYSSKSFSVTKSFVVEHFTLFSENVNLSESDGYVVKFAVSSDTFKFAFESCLHFGISWTACYPEHQLSGGRIAE